jgi:hypothetical protein
MKPTVISSEQELLDLLRKRADELNISRLSLDAIAGLPDR